MNVRDTRRTFNRAVALPKLITGLVARAGEVKHIVVIGLGAKHLIRPYAAITDSDVAKWASPASRAVARPQRRSVVTVVSKEHQGIVHPISRANRSVPCDSGALESVALN